MRLVVLGWLVLFGVLPACRGGRAIDERPEAVLAASTPAQTEFRSLRQRWFSSSRAERARLEPELRRFVVRYPGDERTRSVQIFLAWIEIDRNRHAAAKTLIRAATVGTQGAVADAARVAEAAILTRTGAPERALALLDPLGKKIVDQDERLVFGEERVLASLAARRYPDAVHAMLGWLAQAGTEARDRVQASISELLPKIPRAQLLQGLQRLDQEAREHEDGSTLVSARNWLRKTIRDDLTRHALAESDPQLAEQLLDRAPAAARASESGIQLGRIAAGKLNVPLIAGRSVGLVLSLGTPEARRRSARVAAGMSRALDVLGTAADPAGVRLVTRDDAASDAGIDRALAELAAEGAGILVAGVDEHSSESALRYAESTRIPVILLALPKQLPAELKYAFVLGSSKTEEGTILDEELKRRAHMRSARVGTPDLPCNAVPSAAGAPRFPIDEWRKSRLEAIIVLGDVDCARDVLGETRAIRERPRIGVGLEASSLLASGELGPGDFGLAAGVFPSKARPAGAAKPLSSAGEPPLDWYEVLGHDAAVLAKAALASFPMTRIEDARAVGELHVRAERALRAASSPLWSSEKLGFLGKHVLERKLSITTSANVK